jgi:type IV pilus assembly protein PilV
MLEVLIAIVVISFGLLGLAGLQAVGLKNNQTAYLRAIATQQAYDMADRMRANRAGVYAASSVGSYDNITGVGSDPGCISTGCSTANMALYDQYAWNTANAALLPNGAGTVTGAGGTPSTLYTIAVTWTEACSTGETSCTSGTITRSFSTSFLP